MFCGHPENITRPDELNCYCGRGEPCPNCGFLSCRCTPAPCCGAPWSPLDWQNRGQCYICAKDRGPRLVPVMRMESVSLVDVPPHPSWRVTKVDGQDV